MNEKNVVNSAGETKKLSLGEIRTGVKFPALDEVSQSSSETFKAGVATQINTLEDMRQFAKSHPEMAGEINRWLSTAQTHLEIAADMAVKGLSMIDKQLKAAE